MLRFQRQFAAWCGGLAVLAATTTTEAQIGCECGPSASMFSQAAVVTQSVPCATTVMQPVVQSVMQSVPVTEYHPVTQITRRPKVETRIMNQDVIEYHPETEVRTMDVPTTTYQDVTEYHQVCKNAGYYQTQVHQVAKTAPCAYDQRPGLMGWMNRTGMEIRNAFTPNQIVRREFVPQTVMQTVPVTRRVAVQGTRQVSYNVTKMVAARTTRQVATNHVTYEDVHSTAMVPRTVMRHVPVGTQISGFAPLGASSQLSLTPTPDNSASARSQQNNRSAINRKNGDPFPQEQNPDLYKDQQPIKPKAGNISFPRPAEPDPGYPSAQERANKSTTDRQAVAGRTSPPSVVRLNKWVARTPTPQAESTSSVSLADVKR